MSSFKALNFEALKSQQALRRKSHFGTDFQAQTRLFKFVMRHHPSIIWDVKKSKNMFKPFLTSGSHVEQIKL